MSSTFRFRDALMCPARNKSDGLSDGLHKVQLHRSEKLLMLNCVEKCAFSSVCEASRLCGFLQA